MTRLIVNLVAFKVGWFACVLGGANGLPAVALLVVSVVVIAHLLTVDRPLRTLALLAVAGATGALIDTVQMHLGIISFPGREDALLVPAWFAAFWVNFATLLRGALRWMQHRLPVAALLGLLGGPAAYYAGAKLGAVELDANLTLAMLAVGIEWMVVLPFLALLARSFSPTEERVPREHPAASYPAQTAGERIP